MAKGFETSKVMFALLRTTGLATRHVAKMQRNDVYTCGDETAILRSRLEVLSRPLRGFAGILTWPTHGLPFFLAMCPPRKTSLPVSTKGR